MKRLRPATLALMLLTAPALSADELAAKIDEIFADYDSTHTPGCAAALVRDGKIAYQQGYGMANLDHDVPISSSSVFHVASVSKQFTAAAIVLLALDGKLSLDDEIHKYLPEIHDFGVPITIRQLVHHVSGLRDQWALLELSGWRYSQDLISNDDVMWILERQRELNFPPGAEHLYSNSGYTLLGQIVERVTGKSLREFTRENIFEPLGMNHTFFRDDFQEVVKNQAYGYSPRADDEGRYELSVTNFDTVGATSLLTTVEDMARWDANFDQAKVGGKAFVEQMHARYTLSNGEETDYAFGLVHGDYRGLTTVSHGGADAGYRSYFVRFPEHRVSVAVLCNVPAGPSGLAMQIADLALADALGETADPGASKAVELEAAALAEKAGLYWNPRGDDFVEIVLKESGLRAVFGASTFPLVAIAADRFRFEAIPYEIEFTSEPASMTLITSSGEPVEWQRVEPIELADGALAGYAGTYDSEEIGIPYQFDIKDDTLVLQRMKAEPDVLKPAMRDVFTGNLGTVRFTRDEQGALSGFLLSGDRIRNLRFSKR